MGAHSENEETPHKTPADYNDISQVGENAKVLYHFLFPEYPFSFNTFARTGAGREKKILTFSSQIRIKNT